MHIDDNQNPFSLVADFEGDESSVFDVEMEATLPILPLRNMVLFPGVVMPVAVGRKSSLRLAKAADKNKLNIGVVCQLSPETENPGFDDLYHIGTMAKIIRILELPDRSTTVILQGMSRFDLKGIVSDQPYLTGMVEKLEDTLPSKNNKEFEILVEACRERTMQQQYVFGKLCLCQFPFPYCPQDGVVEGGRIGFAYGQLTQAVEQGNPILGTSG